MFWLRNKKNIFQLHSLIWGPVRLALALACWVILSSFKSTFLIFFFRIIPSECQTVWTKIRPDIDIAPDLGPNCLQRLSRTALVGKEFKSVSRSKVVVGILV